MFLAKKVRGATAILTAIAYNCILTFPHLALYTLRNHWSEKNRSAYRNGMTIRMTEHGERLFRWLCNILDVTVEFEAPTSTPLRGDPLIVISNHQSIMDIPLLFAIMHWLKIDHTRWVMKKEIGKTPFGWFSRIVNSAFVSRRGEKSDLMAIRECAWSANQDGAAVILFPEGTRFVAPIPDSGFTFVRPPKTTGFELLREYMPRASILSVTLCWKSKQGEGHHGGRTVFDTDGFVGKRLIVRLEQINADAIDQTPDWLINHWRKKDLELAELTLTSQKNLGGFLFTQKFTAEYETTCYPGKSRFLSI